MAPPTRAPTAEKGADEEKEEEEEQEEGHAAYYHPPAPSSEGINGRMIPLGACPLILRRTVYRISSCLRTFATIFIMDCGSNAFYGAGCPGRIDAAGLNEALLFDTTTTVDPSYIISLIRKLIPSGERTEHGSHHYAAIQGPETSHGEQSAGVLPHQECSIGDKDRNSTNGTIPNQESAQEILADDNSMNPEFEVREGNDGNTCEQPGVSFLEDPWEESGCILWDLAANKTHAEFMVENLLPEVLLTSLVVSKSVRVTEICLGILGNLACHEVPRNALTSTNGLVEAVVNQLFLDDPLCLSGTCWLLTLALQGSESVTWAEELLPENVLCRILWIAGNTLNSQLLEKCLELLSTIIESQQVAPILLPSLVELGLLSLLVNLLASEMDNVASGKGLDRCFIIDSILCVVESLSISSDYSQAVSSNVELFQLICGMIKLPDKVEVADSCVTAVVLVANILTDNPNLLSEISKDLSFLHGLLDILPFVSNDSQARSALWSTLARVLSAVEANAMSKLDLQQYATLLVEKSGILNEDLDDHREEDSAENQTKAGKTNAKIATLRKIAKILESRCDILQKDAGGGDASYDEDVQRLLNYCREYAN